jgi:hypothetical protein
MKKWKFRVGRSGKVQRTVEVLLHPVPAHRSRFTVKQTYRARARSDPPCVTTHEQHTHHNKDKVIVSATKQFLQDLLLLLLCSGVLIIFIIYI